MTLILSTERKQLDSILEANIAIVEDINNDSLTRKSSMFTLKNFLIEVVEKHSFYSDIECLAIWILIQKLTDMFSELN